MQQKIKFTYAFESRVKIAVVEAARNVIRAVGGGGKATALWFATLPLAFSIYTSLLFKGMYVRQGVILEKERRRDLTLLRSHAWARRIRRSHKLQDKYKKSLKKMQEAEEIVACEATRRTFA